MITFFRSKFWSEVPVKVKQSWNEEVSIPLDVLLSWHMYDWIWISIYIINVDNNSGWTPLSVIFLLPYSFRSVFRGGCLLSLLVRHIYVLQATATLRIWGKTLICFPLSEVPTRQTLNLWFVSLVAFLASLHISFELQLCITSQW